MEYREFVRDRNWDDYDIRDAFATNLRLARSPLQEVKLPLHSEHNLPERNKDTDKK